MVVPGERQVPVGGLRAQRLLRRGLSQADIPADQAADWALLGIGASRAQQHVAAGQASDDVRATKRDAAQHFADRMPGLTVAAELSNRLRLSGPEVGR
ncbi:hypothetical protein I0C86_27715 [Plantactinospora sp. S1510]|uniref:Uncharacterized protein n=1 Tax=Plantactinospora alkalitolerans TaxID=2789879 RepID=A0ABS0H3K6_9ACTN|nr:hypothetical protein [Plantactinospora alkalitolerans]MBF9132714.1 hypothetical protein [Plantactinospora alkalitolerans]